MSASLEQVLEPHSRHIGSAQLFINADASWSVGPSTNALVKVRLGEFKTINDDTFGFSAVAVESNGHGGYRLFVRSDAQNDTLVEVSVSATGEVDPASVAVLTKTQMYALEDQYHIDLNDNGGFGNGSVLLEGGAVNLYMDADGAYQLGAPGSTPTTLTIGGQALTDELLPLDWWIVDQMPADNGWTVFAEAPNGAIYAADFAPDGQYTGGRVLSDAELEEFENAQGLDIDDDGDLAAPAGWTRVIQDPAIRAWIDAALGSTAGVLALPSQRQPLEATTASGTMSYTEVVALCKNLIQSHKDAGATPITAEEVSSLQALAARGKAAFAAEGNADEYLAYVFSKMVGNSEANRFYTGGQAQRSELGGLTAGTTVAQFEKLVDKWLLGGDLPNSATGGDTATGNAQAARPIYSKSTGSLYVDGVALADVNQGSAGDCYLIAVLGATAGTQPQMIQSMVVENPAIDGTRSWGVRFFDAQGKAHWVTVNDMLPTRQDDDGAIKLSYAGSSAKDLNGEIWVPLIEKAYAQANMLGILPRAETSGQNSYMAVEGGQGDPLAQLMAGRVTMYSVTSDPEQAGASPLAGNAFVTMNAVNGSDAAAVATLEGTLKAVINSGKPVWIGVTTAVKDSFGNQLLVGSHAHYAVDAAPADPDNNTVLVYNPWGLQALPQPPGPTPNEFISPAPYTLTELIGIPGLDFGVLEPLAAP